MAGEKINDIQERELLAKLADPKFFIESCLSIIDKNSKDVPLILNPIQNNFLENKSPLVQIGNQSLYLDCILKARKEGFSALIEALWLHACITQKNVRAVIVSHEEKSTSRLLERFRYYISSSVLKIRTQKNSAQEISFPDTNSTCWIGTAGQRAFGRGDDITHLHFSEYLFYPNFSIITGAAEAMRNGGWIILESTANGAGTEGHKFWQAKNGYKKHFFGWQDNREYSASDDTPFEIMDDEKILKKTLNLAWAQLRWRRAKISTMIDPSLFSQEYPANGKEAFRTSGQMAFKWEDLKRQEDGKNIVKWICDLENIGSQVVIRPNEKGNLRIWRTPANAF